MGSASALVIGVSVVFYLVAFGLALGAMAKRSKVAIIFILSSHGLFLAHIILTYVGSDL